MKLEELMNEFKVAEDNDYLFIGVAVKMPNLNKPEIIINPYSNFKYKKEYYMNAYDENLCLKNNPEIKIIGAISSDYISDIVIALS